MRMPTKFHTKTAAAVLLAAGIVGGGVAVKESIGSDHQQTAFTELNPAMDITDVFVFPGATDDRIVLAITVGSPIAGDRFAGIQGNQQARFDPNALYQIKVDNNMDGREDMVFQFSFDQLANGSQTFDVIGPVAPRDVGILASGQRDAFSTAAPRIRRAALNATATGGTMQAWAGLRDDPFYVDLEQFFRIIPDRRPTQGPLSQIGGVTPAQPGVVASSWRPACTNGTPNAGQANRDQRFGCAVDFLRGLNALAIVVELPESEIMRTGAGSDEIGVWATVSR
jgi:hypothetical protein